MFNSLRAFYELHIEKKNHKNLFIKKTSRTGFHKLTQNALALIYFNTHHSKIQ